MNKFKFFSISDKAKEAIKIFPSENLKEAYIIASGFKKLTIGKFRKLFKIEKIK